MINRLVSQVIERVQPEPKGITTPEFSQILQLPVNMSKPVLKDNNYLSSSLLTTNSNPVTQQQCRTEDSQATI